MSKATEKAKARQDKILDFMKTEIQQRGYAPTVREICTALNIKSTSTVHKDLNTLESEGLIHRDPAKPRALVITDMTAPAKPAHQASSPDCISDGVENIHTIGIPIVGNVAAGMPITAEENIESHFPVPAEYVTGNNFMLRVRGESMINVGIYDGDLILVRQQETASNGDIVVAMVDGFESEATVKTFYKESDHIRLQPENDTMSPILVKDVKILGKVAGVFRYYN